MCALPAHGHEAPTGWTYPLSCCSNLDCREVEASLVKEHPLGYVAPNGEVITRSDSRLKVSPDGRYHWCADTSADFEGLGTTSALTICLFVPPPAF